MNDLKLDNYKQQLAEIYTRRSDNYDESKWHPQITHSLVEKAQIRPGQAVLDIATGTGHVALEVAQLVGDSGRVVGVDIAPGMLEKARNKVRNLNLKNVEFILADGELLDFPANSFDRILCANAFPLFPDKEGTLKLWCQLLKPGGIIGLHSMADKGFAAMNVLQKILQKYGIILPLFQLADSVSSVEKYRQLLEKAGLEPKEIKTEQYGNYVSLEEAKKRLNLVDYPTPGNDTHPLSELSDREVAKIKAEFEEELEALATTEGVWNEGTTFLVLGCKL
ncbi:class I SAM-dependent methyltransferase [Oscillatoria salina]|uniref:class I SAM-dependent methyltransferase n=1 Tax=Oscillatoria salina TaxID=331517 RepID=UPI001CCE1668|nr:methyltransferase domain-containing protein [Oscillatoria salina]MBZ8182647.1 methyltransferase domain-containing protein [Oscillatoria salina IIICB1]